MDYQKQTALIVFLKHPEKGKVKTRLAKDIGESAALFVYEELIAHTLDVAKSSLTDVWLFYNHDDIELPKPDSKRTFVQIQNGNDLGQKMNNAFETVFQQGYQKAIIIGSDCIELHQNHIKMAFQKLTLNDIVIGPAHDGGYYLLGQKKLHPEIFEDINWSTREVFEKTVEKVTSLGLKHTTLETLSDIDTLEELKRNPILYNMVK